MANADDIRWFKRHFAARIESAVRGTGFTTDMLTAIACQETGELWSILRTRPITVDRVLELCCGDTIDASSSRPRRVFPRTKAELVAVPNGQQMFDIARQALVDMARHTGIRAYQRAAAMPNKICHGFGIFQYDLQFFRPDPDYFLQKRYADFDACLAKCLGELLEAKRDLGWGTKTSLTDYEMTMVAIVYNIGIRNYREEKGLRQGYESGGKYYGENILDYIRLSRRVVPHTDTLTLLTPTAAGTAPLPPPTPVEASGKLYEVDVTEHPLRLRSEPKIVKSNPTSNVVVRLPDGHIVQAVKSRKVSGFLEVETSLNGAHFRGFAAAKYLKPASGIEAVPVAAPAVTAAGGVLVAVHRPRKSDFVTRRTEIATSYSLNESGQPGRSGTSPDELRAELGAIVEWLAVDKPSHRRYKKRDGLTFCNIYAHDFCHLAGVYLPRVWWTPLAIEALARGQNVPLQFPRYIDEVRANGLSRWLADFGLRFGWRQTGSLSKLQLEVNQGAVGLIVARRRSDGPPGHITVVVPETDTHSARRDAAGEVIAPLQSQAGVTNFRYGTGRLNWWKDERFADCAFWVHP